MNMQTGPAVIAYRDVARCAENLTLFIDFDLAVALRSNVEPADRCPLEGADRRQRSCRNSRVIGKPSKGGERFLASIQNRDVNLGLVIGADPFALHRDSSRFHRT